MRSQKIGMRLKIVRSKSRACGCDPGFRKPLYFRKYNNIKNIKASLHVKLCNDLFTIPFTSSLIDPWWLRCSTWVPSASRWQQTVWRHQQEWPHQDTIIRLEEWMGITLSRAKRTGMFALIFFNYRFVLIWMFFHGHSKWSIEIQ